MRAWGMVPVVLLAMAVAGCSGSGGSDGDEAPVGTVLDEPINDGLGGRSWVMTPEGRIDFVVAEPRKDFPGFHEEYDRAADGSSFVAVTWEWDFHTQIGTTVTGEEPEPSFALVVDGRDYSLDDAMLRSRDEDSPSTSEDDPQVDFRGTAWVVVKGEPDEIDLSEGTITAEFDGLEQTVPLDESPRAGDLGSAEFLYGLNGGASESRIDCRAPSLPRRWRPNNTGCQLQVMRVPWYQPVGWAEPGRVFVVVTMRGWIQSVHGRDGRAHFLDGPVSATATLNGAKPAKVIEERERMEAGKLEQVLVFDVDASELDSDLSIQAMFTTGVDEGAFVEVPARWALDLHLP